MSAAASMVVVKITFRSAADILLQPPMPLSVFPERFYDMRHKRALKPAFQANTCST